VTRLVVDENLSPALAAGLRARGHDAVHVNAVGLNATEDRVIMGWAARHRRIVVTADHDFHEHLFTGAAMGPSVIRVSQRGPVALAGAEVQARRLGELLPVLGVALADGAAVTIDRAGHRLDRLPLRRRVERRPERDRRPGGVPEVPRDRDQRRAAVVERVRERRLDRRPPGGPSGLAPPFDGGRAP